MSSLWKDLLFLHGYLVRKEDLLWRDQPAVGSTTRATPAEAKSDKLAITKTKAKTVSEDRPSHWPRLTAPH